MQVPSFHFPIASCGPMSRGSASTTAAGTTPQDHMATKRRSAHQGKRDSLLGLTSFHKGQGNAPHSSNSHQENEVFDSSFEEQSDFKGLSLRDLLSLSMVDMDSERSESAKANNSSIGDDIPFTPVPSPTMNSSMAPRSHAGIVTDYPMQPSCPMVSPKINNQDYPNLCLQEDESTMLQDCHFDLEAVDNLPVAATLVNLVFNDEEKEQGVPFVNSRKRSLESSSIHLQPITADVTQSYSSMTSQSPNKRSRTIQDVPQDKEAAPEDDSSDSNRFRPYQAGQWADRFQELLEYRQVNGDCLVPHTYLPNLPLARWVKRQRYQYKLLVDSRSSSASSKEAGSNSNSSTSASANGGSTMTWDRVRALEAIGFVWNSQLAAWKERLGELKQYRNTFGNCNVPSMYGPNPQLATWVKCQRRQYKLYCAGKNSNMNAERVKELQDLGFEWQLRQCS